MSVFSTHTHKKRSYYKEAIHWKMWTPTSLMKICRGLLSRRFLYCLSASLWFSGPSIWAASRFKFNHLTLILNLFQCSVQILNSFVLICLWEISGSTQRSKQPNWSSDKFQNTSFVFFNYYSSVCGIIVFSVLVRFKTYEKDFLQKLLFELFL